MGRFAYTLTMGFVLAAGAMLWIEHRGTSQVLAWLEPRTAQAQSHEPADPPPAWRAGEAAPASSAGNGPLARAAVAVNPPGASPSAPVHASEPAKSAAIPSAGPPPWAALPPGIRTTGKIEPLEKNPATTNAATTTAAKPDSNTADVRGPVEVAARPEKPLDLEAGPRVPLVAGRQFPAATEAPAPSGLANPAQVRDTWQGYPLGTVLEIEGTPMRDGAFEVTTVNGKRIPMSRLRAKLEPTIKTIERPTPDGRIETVSVAMERAIPVAPSVRMRGQIQDQGAAGLLFVATDAEDARATPTGAPAPQGPVAPAQPFVDPNTGYTVTPFPAAAPAPVNSTPKAYQLPPSQPPVVAESTPAETRPHPAVTGELAPVVPRVEAPAPSVPATTVATTVPPQNAGRDFLPWRRTAAKPVSTPGADAVGIVSVAPEQQAAPNETAHALPARDPLRPSYATTETPAGPQVAPPGAPAPQTPTDDPGRRYPGYGAEAPSYASRPTPEPAVAPGVAPPVSPESSGGLPPIEIAPPTYAQTPPPAAPPTESPAAAPPSGPPSYAARPYQQPAAPPAQREEREEPRTETVATADVAPWRRGVADTAASNPEPAPEARPQSGYPDATAARREGVQAASFSADTDPRKRDLSPVEVGATPKPKPAIPSNSETDAITDQTILALVNSEAILAGEVLPAVEARLAQVLAQAPPDQLEAVLPELARAKKMLLQGMLEPLIQRKLLYQDARREIPKPNYKNVEEQLVKDFDSRIDQMVAKRGLANRRQLDEEMSKQGNSLAQQRKTFIEEMLAREWLKRNSEINETIRREELLTYYREHQSDYEVKARARWEQLMVRFDKFKSKDEARFAMGKLGNRVLDREDFATVAKSASHGATASEGGKRPWTTQGALVSKALDEALFTLPVGQLSPILEDEQGLHIIRVVERQEAGKKPFEDVQGDIREKIKADRREKAQEKYVEKLQANAHIWRLLGDPEVKQAEGKKAKRS